jgi:prepilin-type N-terminal cleavage/methylation domain-containing protein
MARPTTAAAEVREIARPGGRRHDHDAGTRGRMALRLLCLRTMRDDRGFSLIEVLVIVVLIGILSGLAISQYASFRARGFDSTVAAAVRGVATGEEAYYAHNQAYAPSLAALDTIGTGDVTIVITPGNSGSLESSFRVTGSHPGATRDYTWLSDPEPGQPNLIESQS